MARRKFKGFGRRKRRRSGGGGGGGGRKFGGLVLLNKGIVIKAGAAAAGFIGANLLIDKVAQRLPAVSQGYARIGTKAALGGLLGGVVSKFGRKPELGAAIAIGGVASALMDLYATFRPAPSLKGFYDGSEFGADYGGEFVDDGIGGFVQVVPG